MESTSYVFSFRMVFFYLVATSWIFYISLCENSISQSNYTVLYCIILCDRHDPITFMRPCARHSTLDVQLTFFLGTIDELLEL